MPPKKQKNRKQKGFKVGKIVFSESMPACKKPLIQNLQKKINLNGFRWELINGIFLDNKVPQIFQHCVDLNINHLGLSNNQHVTILKDINIIKYFSKLEVLILPQNLVSNIQDLQFLNAPFLWRLDIRKNKISSLKSIQKVTLPKLSMFVFGQNIITSVDTLNKANFPVVSWYDFTQNKELHDFSKLLKGCNKQLQHAYFQGCSVVNPSKTLQYFYLKYGSKYNLHIKVAMYGNDQFPEFENDGDFNE